MPTCRFAAHRPRNVQAQEESSELLNRSIQLLGLEPRVHVIHGDLRDEGTEPKQTRSGSLFRECLLAQA